MTNKTDNRVETRLKNSTEVMGKGYARVAREIIEDIKSVTSKKIFVNKPLSPSVTKDTKPGTKSLSFSERIIPVEKSVSGIASPLTEVSREVQEIDIADPYDPDFSITVEVISSITFRDADNRFLTIQFNNEIEE